MSDFLEKQLDYDLISKIECDFFTGLSKSAGHFRGREYPGDENCTVEAAIGGAASFVNSRGNSTLDVTVCFDVSNCRSRNRAHMDRMYLGTRLLPDKNPEKQQITHFIALTKGNSCQVKLHLDLDFHVSSDEPKPSPHIQIGGRPLAVREREFSKLWNEHLDKPRWPCLPCCTPLLWHAAFMEFQECESVGPFLRQGWWKTLVRQAESALWIPFFDDMKRITARRSAIEAFYPPAK